jgi:antitoxin component YwqK of YwqJK toxin-antitoxin module
MARILREEKYTNGTLKYQETLLDDQLGKRVTRKELWHYNGQQEFKENYINGQKHGLQEGWFNNGQRWNKENYVNGQLHGTGEIWFDNGHQDYKKYYLDDTQVSQETYQAYIQRLASQIQETLDLEEPNLSRIIAGYLLP